MRRYSPRQVARTLAKYDTTETLVEVSPSLRLALVETADAYELLDRLIAQEEAGGAPVARFPYWAEIWPSAVGLSRWFAGTDLPAWPGRVLELGCGLGLVGVTLARLGYSVEATDYVEDALIFAAHNAERNGAGARHRVSYLDWCHPVGESHELLVASDVAYEKSLHPHLRRVLGALLAPGGRVVFSDPARPTSQRLFAELEADGYRHSHDRIQVTWNALQHGVDIHAFERPA